MAARKKAKAMAKRKKTPARKKPIAVKKTTVKKKAGTRRAAPKKTAARRTAPKKAAAPKVAAPKPAAPKPAMKTPAAPKPAAPAPRVKVLGPLPPVSSLSKSTVKAPAEQRVGVVTHYFSHLSVASVWMESGTLSTGDTVHISGHTSDFRQRVESMQVEHQDVQEVTAGQEFGLKVVEHAREHDVVYKVIAPTV